MTLNKTFINHFSFFFAQQWIHEYRVILSAYIDCSREAGGRVLSCDISTFLEEIDFSIYSIYIVVVFLKYPSIFSSFSLCSLSEKNLLCVNRIALYFGNCGFPTCFCIAFALYWSFCSGHLHKTSPTGQLDNPNSNFGKDDETIFMGPVINSN